MKNLVIAFVAMYSLADVKECFKKEIEACGDKICEMSTDSNVDILKQVESNVLDCLRGLK